VRVISSDQQTVVDNEAFGTISLEQNGN
jgi:hypothetical protein